MSPAASFIAFVAAVAVAAFSGSRFKPDAWYRNLRKPTWNPPDAVFAPVWTVLYLAVATAAWLVWRGNGDAWSLALTLWVVQLVLNVAWSWLFFGRHQVAGALIDIVLLLVAIVAFIATSASASGIAAWLFVPYALWVAFAATLNARILALNSGAT